MLLGIDVGTTYCKAVVLDADGGELAQARARTPWTRVPTGAEIDPHALVETALSVAAEAIAAAPAGAVVAVGIAGMAETGVLLDARGAPRRPGDRVARRPAGPRRRPASPPTSAAGSSRCAPACRPRRCAR